MAGAMVPRNAGEERLAQQQRRNDLAQHTKAIRDLIPVYRQHRDAIRDHLWQVYEQRLYVGSHRNFEQWFLASGFALQLSVRTAQRMIREKRPPGGKKKKVPPSGGNSNQKGSKLKDFYKNPLPDNCKPVYMNAVLQKVIDQIGEAIGHFVAPEFQFALEREKDRLPWYDAKLFQERVQALAHGMLVVEADLQANRPAGVCPKCGGQKCEHCLSSGMVPKAVYERLKQENADG